MGRPRRYRERIQFEMASVQVKSLRHLLAGVLRKDFGRSRLEAEVLAGRSLEWLRGLGLAVLPGQAWVSVPATPSRRYARQRRRMALVTFVDVGEDAEVWREYGLAVMQRRRILRWLGEIYRQGGWASLTEVAAWANLTPTALGARLKPVRDLGIWLPHVGGPAPSDDRLTLEPWLVMCYLAQGAVEPFRRQLGITPAAWEGILRRFVQVLERVRAGESPDDIAGHLGVSPLEVREFASLGERYRGERCLEDLQRAYGTRLPVGEEGLPEIERELVEQYGFSPVAARLYRQWLADLVQQMGGKEPGEGETTVLAISSEEGARARLAEARHVPVRISYFTADDAREGPYGESRTRVRGLKWGRILRYATQARSQGALLTLPDLAVLMGIHVDAIRHRLGEHPEVVVPTRGRVKDIGRGVSHKAQVVELYLQMHTETEITQRTGHSYESVERYLRDFARVVSLADQGLNAVMIRQVTGRSLALVSTYLELYRRYDRPEHYFRLAQLRRVFAKDEAGEKRGSRFRSRTGGVMR